jgi:arylsulfatase A-like enzyme
VLRGVKAAGTAALLMGCAEAQAPAGVPNVVIVTLESTRTDVVGAYGGGSVSRPEVPVTPAIDALAESATLYGNAFSVTSWTLSAHASLFTGLYPTAHQTDGPRDRLDDSYPTLAEALASRGFATAGVVSGPYLRHLHGLSQGFDQWVDGISAPIDPLAHDDVTNPEMLAALEHWLDARDPARPFLLFAYFWDPHFDFRPPPPYDEMFVGDADEPMDAGSFDTNPAIHPYMAREHLDWIQAQYLGEVRWTDEHLGRLFAALRERGLWDDTLVILTADHGEEFFDHGGKGHKKNLHVETVHIPLIVKYPGQQEGLRDDRLVSLVDVAPTVLDVAGFEPDFPVQGRSLRAPPSPGRAIFFDLLATRYTRQDAGAVAEQVQRWRAVQDTEHKLIRRGQGDAIEREELYATGSDPGGREDLARGSPERLSRLRVLLGSHLDESARIAADYRRGGEVELGPEEHEQLRALGYLGP